MERREWAKQINCEVEELTRIQGTNWKEDWEEGQILTVGKDLGLSWTDGGNFTPENEKEFMYVITITGNIKAHKVDYTNEKEVFELGAEDCEKEKEYLIPEGTQFRVTWAPQEADYEMMGYYCVELELVEDEEE